MLYRYFNYEGFEKTIISKSIRFSNINSWRNGSSNDCNENYIASCIESEKDFNRMMDVFNNRKLSNEEIFRWIYYVCLYTYNTYVACFSETIENQDYMWNEFTKKGGVCIAFTDDLYHDLEKEYSQHINPNCQFKFYKDYVEYVPSIPSVESTLNQIGNQDHYLRLAYFTKLDKPYEKEQETRIAITKMNIMTLVGMQLVEYTKDYDRSFQGINHFIKTKMGFDIFDKTHVSLCCDVNRYIDHICISPRTNETEKKKIIELCNDNKLYIGGINE